MVFVLTEGRNVEPLHAESYFIVERNGNFNQILKYYFLDPNEYYYSLMHKPEKYEKEMKRLYNIMKELLSEEKIIINNVHVNPKIEFINIDFIGFVDQPYITYYIKFKGPLKRGFNVFEDYYEKTVAEYDYEIYWFFPDRTRIVEVVVDGDFEVLKNKLFIWARKGDRISGYEKIVFKFH